jgi:hypothetical protein
LNLSKPPGRGDHWRVYFGDRRSELPGKRGEIKPNTFRVICKQLGIKPEDL